MKPADLPDSPARAGWQASQQASRQGSNSTALRRLNERRLLTALRRLGHASKADLARHLNLTQNTVGQIVQDLEQDGLVSSAGRRMGERGQPATLLRLDPAGAYSIGVKLGRHGLDALIVDLTGTVLKRRHYPCASTDPAEIVQLASRSIRDIRRSLPKDRRGRLLGVGMALPSDPAGRQPRDSQDPPERWAGLDLDRQLRPLLDVPLLIESQAAAAAVAELYHGHGRQLDDFCCIYISSGIGAGLVLDGDYRRGAAGSAGEIGLVPVPPSALPGPPSLPAGQTLLADRASGSALARHLAAHGAPVSAPGGLEAALDSHPGPVAEWLQDCAEALVAPLLSVARMGDVEAIILDGNLPAAMIESILVRLGRLVEARDRRVVMEGTLRL